MNKFKHMGRGDRGDEVQGNAEPTVFARKVCIFIPSVHI